MERLKSAEASMSTSCSHYFLETIRGAERVGLDGDALLGEVKLNRRQISDPTWRGPSESLAQLVQLVWLALGDEFMGFTENRCRYGVFAMVVHAILREDTIERALDKAVLYYSIITDDIKMEVEATDETVALIMTFSRPDLDPNHYFHEFWLSIWYRLVSWMGGRLAPLKEAHFSYPKPETRVQEFGYMFPGQLQFDTPTTALVFERSFLQESIKRNRDELKQLLATAPLGFMTTPIDVTSYSRKVRYCLLPKRQFPIEFPSFSHVARELAIAEQSLRRKLRSEGSSFREIKESIRREVAVEKIIRGNKSVAELAELLGYSETRAFARAFKTWTGMSPVQYRDHFKKHLRLEHSCVRIRG